MLPFVPMTQFYSAPIVISYLGFDLSSVDIGPERADRIIVYAGVGEDDSPATLSSCMFNGISGTIIANPAVPDNGGMAYAVVPTGTTITVVPSQPGFRIGFLWIITGYKYGFDNVATTGASTVNPTTPMTNSTIVGFARARGPGIGGLSMSGSGLLGSSFLDANVNTGGGTAPSVTVGHGYGNATGGTLAISGSGSTLTIGAVFK